MRFEPVTKETANKLYKPTKLQRVLDEFIASGNKAVRVVLEPGEYDSIKAARGSFYGAIRRLRYPIKTRIINGELYLVLVNADQEVNRETLA